MKIMKTIKTILKSFINNYKKNADTTYGYLF